MIEYGEPKYEEIISYNKLSDIIEKQHLEEPTPEERLYIFKQILDHQGPLKPTDPSYKVAVGMLGSNGKMVPSLLNL